MDPSVRLAAEDPYQSGIQLQAWQEPPQFVKLGVF
jgi:hypothetical protein